MSDSPDTEAIAARWPHPDEWTGGPDEKYHAIHDIHALLAALSTAEARAERLEAEFAKLGIALDPRTPLNWRKKYVEAHHERERYREALERIVKTYGWGGGGHKAAYDIARAAQRRERE